jgi:beta-N-acetylhexosaminidase
MIIFGLIKGRQTLANLIRARSSGALLRVLLCALFLAGCASGPTTSSSATPTLTATATATPPPSPTATPGDTLDQRIDAYIATLSNAQKIGQTLMLAVYASSDNAQLNQDLANYHLGSAIFFPNYNGGPLQPTTISGVQQLLQGLQSHADGPLLLAADEEGGIVDRLSFYYGATPSAQQLAETGNPQNAFAQAQTDAQRMHTLGLNLDFAPVVDVNQGGGAGPSRMFGTTAGTVTTYAGAFLDGLQQNGVAGTLKHWPGLGAATGNPDFALPTISSSQAQMNAVDFAPFRALLSHQLGMIMATTVMVPAFDNQNPAMLSPMLISTVLRGQLGYNGVVVTDALDAQGLITYMSQQGFSTPAQGIAEASVRAMLAGDDLIELPIEQDRLAAVVTAMTQAVQSGRIPQSRLDDAVHRILRLNVRMGLLTLPS